MKSEFAILCTMPSPGTLKLVSDGVLSLSGPPGPDTYAAEAS